MTQSNKLRVFISYSREDLKFADQLDLALDLSGFDCILDRHGIHGGEDWRKRLGNLILEADTIVFVLSPTSAASEICEWEVEEAARLGKRILPVLCCPLDGTEPPPRLKGLNYIYFYDEPNAPGSGFGAGLTQLVAALNTDLDWLREHTRLLERATEWTEDGRQDTALLFGDSIAEARRWSERHPKTAPDVTALHLEFIRASEEAEARRKDAEHQRLTAMAAAQDERAKAIQEREDAQKREIEASRSVVKRTVIGLVVASVLAVVASGAGLYAYYKRGEALQRGREARNYAKIEAQASSLFRAMQADAALKSNDPVTAAILAMSGVADKESTRLFERKRPFYPESFHALYRAWVNISERAVLAGHSKPLRSAVAAPDGSFIVTVSDDSSARLWDKTGSARYVLKGHEGPLTSIAIAPDSSTLVVGSADGTATVWSPNGKFEKRLSGHSGGITGVAFSPDGTKIVTTARDREARLWSLDGKQTAVFSGHNGVVASPQFSPDGTRILTVSDDQTAAIWSITGERLMTLAGHSGAVVQAVFSADGAIVATASEDGTARLWVTSGEPAKVLDHASHPVTSVAFSQSAKYILTGASDGQSRLWDRNGTLLSTFEGHEGPVTSIAFLPDGERFVTASEDKTVRIWSRDRSLLGILKGHDDAVRSVSFIKDGRSLLTASDDKTARIWDVSGRQVTRLEQPSAAIDVTFSARGSDLVTRHDGGRAILWDTSGKKLAEFRNGAGNSNLISIEISDDGNRILAGYEGGEVVLWSRNGAEIVKIKDDGVGFSGASLSADGEGILTVTSEALRLWDATGKSIATITLEDQPEAVRLSKHGRRIVVLLKNGTIDVWTSEGTKLRQFKVEEQLSAVRSFLSPDGSLAMRSFSPGGIRTGGSYVIDTTANLIDPDPDDQEDPAALNWNPIEVKSATFSQNGKFGFAISSRSSTLDPSRLALRFDDTSVFAILTTVKLDAVIGISAKGDKFVARDTNGDIVLLNSRGQAFLSVEDRGAEIEVVKLSPDGAFIATIANGVVKLWPTYSNPQDLVDHLKAVLPRCLSKEIAESFVLPEKPPSWCQEKYPRARVDGVRVRLAREGTDAPNQTREIDFAYYPPGDVAGGGGRLNDRYVYLPKIIFPIDVPPGMHAYMNSQIYGYGGYIGREAKSIDDPRNYDAMRMRDNYCEKRGWKMPLCPAGKGHQGVDMRPPSPEANKWDVLAVADGKIINTSKRLTSVRLEADDKTQYLYLHLEPSSIRVKAGQRVRQGEVLGKVSNWMNGRRQTSIQLHFQARQTISVGGRTMSTYVPPYTSLIAAYRELKGLDRGVDSDGNLIVDPEHEIGAGKIPRPPE